MIINNRVDSLQIIRAFAAVLVVICHLWNDGWLPKNITDLGGFGVDLFFILSGFIMCLTVRLDKGSRYSNAKNFLQKRIIRIFPIYLICAIPLILFNLKAVGFKGIFFYVGNVLLLPSFTDNPQYALVLGPGWTLVYEMLFYYVFTVIICFTYSKNHLFLLLIFLLSCIVAATHLFNIQGEQLGWVNFTYIIGDTLILNFVLGIVCFYSYQALKEKIRMPVFFTLLCLLVLTVLAAYLHSLDLPRFIAFGLPAFITVFLFTCTRNNGSKSRAQQAIIYIGDASYSIYLTHYYVVFFKPKVVGLHRFFHVEPSLFINTVDVLLIGIAVVSGCIFYNLVEKPIIKYVSYRLTKKLV